MPIRVVTEPQERQWVFDQFLRCLDREETLIHYRLTWGLQWNVALFAALFAAQQLHLQFQKQTVASIFLGLIGVGVSCSSLIGVRAAHEQAKFLIDDIKKRLGVIGDDWRETEFIRPYGKPDKMHLPARRVSIFFPAIFIGIWFLLILYEISLFNPHEFIIEMLSHR